MKINDLAPSKKTKLVIFIVRSDDKCLTLTESVTRFNLTLHRAIAQILLQVV